MPSLGKKLTAEFEAEFVRLANDWYLKWHELARGQIVEVDDFRGGVLYPPSKFFDAASEYAYWTAIRRYADNKIAETFTRIETEARLQSGERSLQTVDECAIALRSFLERLYRHAVFTEYRLQARGYPEERYLELRRDQISLEEVQRRKAALLKRLGSRSWSDWIMHAFARPWTRRLAWVGMLFVLASGCLAVFGYMPEVP